MAISLNNIQSGIVRTINALVGKDACPNRQLFTSPVIKARQGGPIPKYPVVVIDKLGTGQYGISSTSASYFNEQEQFVRETNYKAIFSITVHGSKDDDVQKIAQEIRDTFFREYGKVMLHEETGAGLLGISSPNFTFNYLKTEYEEVSRLTIEMSVTDTFVEDDPNCPSTGTIESVVQDGEIENGDDPPIVIQATAP